MSISVVKNRHDSSGYIQYTTDQTKIMSLMSLKNGVGHTRGKKQSEYENALVFRTDID